MPPGRGCNNGNALPKKEPRVPSSCTPISCPDIPCVITLPPTMEEVFRCRASLGARQEIANCRSNLLTVCLEGEVAGFEEAHVSIWNVTPERFGARRQEERIVF